MKIISRYLGRLEDRRLVGNFLRRRDEKAFHELYKRHTPALFQFALRLLAWNKHEAEDVLQDTWLRAVGALPEFRWQSSLRTWLISIVLNCCRELERKRARNSHTALTEVFVEACVSLEYLDLERAIADLPDGYRHVFVLHDLEGYTHAEIGSLLNIEAGTSKSQLHHARRAVRESLQELAATTVNRSNTHEAL